MTAESIQILRQKLDAENLKKLERLGNPHVIDFVAYYVKHCNPDRVFVCDDSSTDMKYVRKAALRNGEEKPLATPGHVIHFDNPQDQGRDKKNTRILLPAGAAPLGGDINTMDRKQGLDEITGIMKGIMAGKEMFVLFRCLAPINGPFSIPAVQITDSGYVAHNDDLLFRPGYEEFQRRGNSPDFFKFIHSLGVTEGGVPQNLDLRRIFIDLAGNTVYSVNNGYGGNSIGPKKLAMRLAILKGSREGWLCEHMFLMGVHGLGGRITYFAGAYPSLCGKTSTAMILGETIIGDDIAYFRIIDGVAHAANVERGVFGIIQGVNPQGDSKIFTALTTPGDVIFSNVLVDENNLPKWIGDGREPPACGVNYAGEWTPIKVDAKGNPAKVSHPNARFTMALAGLDNLDPKADDPNGIPLGGIIYGGRDSDTSVPVQQSFDWVHGMVTMGAALESETTAATIGQEGVREINPMSNIDFLSIPIGEYVRVNIEFGRKVKKPPVIFAANYFIRGKDGKYLNSIDDKRIWLKWMELRANGEADAIKSPVGFIPKYEDLKRLFKEVLGRDYTKKEYDEQFTIRTPELLSKIKRIEEFYKKVPDTPKEVFDELKKQQARIEDARKKHGDYIKPGQLP